MDERLGLGRAIAGVSALALFGSMFLPWFSANTQVEAPGITAFAAEQESVNAWESLSVIDLLLFAVVLLALLLALTGRPGPVVIVGAGLLAVVLILFRLVDPPIDSELEVARKVGLLFALLAAAGISYGGYRALE